MAQGNNYRGECGATLTMRHYSQPRLWWRKIGPELSIPNGRDLYSAFLSMKLPRFVIDGAYNFAAWRPYEAWGPASVLLLLRPQKMDCQAMLLCYV